MHDDQVSPRSGQKPNNPNPNRTSPADTEARLSDDVGWADFRDQTSWVGGDEAAYGAPGSVRPDSYSAQFKLAVDAKNYDLTIPKGRQRLVDNVTMQAHERAVHMPPGTRQAFAIDVRGQLVSPHVLEAVRQRLMVATKGLVLHPDDIVFITE